MCPGRALKPAHVGVMLHCTWHPSALTTELHGQVCVAETHTVKFLGNTDLGKCNLCLSVAVTHATHGQTRPFYSHYVGQLASAGTLS